MAKRHRHGTDFASCVSRIQELIMANSGIDEFYEVLRLIVSKYLSELAGLSGLPSKHECNELLKTKADLLGSVFDGESSLQISDEIHRSIQLVFSRISILGEDFSALDQAFEVLTSRNYKSEKGQFFTPRHVVDMCVEAISPQPGELICDPACGSGAFLKSAYTYVTRKGDKPEGLYGFDYSHRATQVAKVSSLIGANGDISVLQLDSLRTARTHLFDDKAPTIEEAMGPNFHGFDVILTNPPFAGEVSRSSFEGAYEVANLAVSRLERDVLFVERCIQLLKYDGRMAIVLPDNKISSRKFTYLRHWLSTNSKIEAVVSLHRFTFLPYTTQKAAVLFVTKKKPSAKTYGGEAIFYRSDKPGKQSNGSSIYKDSELLYAPAYISLDHDLNEIADDLRGELWKK